MDASNVQFGAAFTSSSGDGRTSSHATEELRGKKRWKPCRAETVIRASFTSGSVVVTQEVHGCYCEPARVYRLRRATLNPGRARRKASKDETKDRFIREARRLGRASRLRNAGDASASLACEAKTA